MTTPYLDVPGFKALSVIRTEFVDELEISQPGFTLGQLTYWTDWLNARLRKRYQVPFALPYPTAVTGWLARLVTVRVYLKRGLDPSDKQFAEYQRDEQAARDEIKEAAESVEGLFDLPLRADNTGSALSKPKTRVYSEQSPYAFTDLQGEAGHAEDSSRGGGTGG